MQRTIQCFNVVNFLHTLRNVLMGGYTDIEVPSVPAIYQNDDYIIIVVSGGDYYMYAWMVSQETNPFATSELVTGK